MPEGLVDPVEKLPLAVRKGFRDEFDNKLPELQTKISGLLGIPEFTIAVNPNQIYAYADDSYAKDQTGKCTYEYFNAFANTLGEWLKKGDVAEAKEAFNKVAHAHKATLVPSMDVSYSGMEIKEGEVRLLFKPSQLGSNIRDVAEKLALCVDKALEEMQTGDLPLIARRTAAIKLYPEIPKLEEKLTKMFGKPYTIQYDLAATIANLKKHIEELDWNTKERIPELAPDYTAQYLKAAVEHLESKKFGSDDMLQEAFNEAADKGIVSFELVEKLKHGRYNDSYFEGGIYKIEATAAEFGSNIRDSGSEVVDRL